MKLSPIGGGEVAPELPVGDEFFVDFTKFCLLTWLFLSFQFIYHFCRRYPSLFGALLFVVSVICFLL